MTTTNTTQETRRPFLNRNVGYVAGLNGGKQAYALLMGAYLTTDADFRTGADGKKDLLRCNIAININPWSLLGKEVEEAHADDPYINADAPFMTLAAFGETAKRYAGLKKGTKILFSGPLSVNTFKRKDGTEGAAVQVIANELMVASSRACDGDDPKGTVHCMTSMYKDQAGNEGEQRLCVLTGTVKVSVCAISPSISACRRQRRRLCATGLSTRTLSIPKAAMSILPAGVKLQNIWIKCWFPAMWWLCWLRLSFGRPRTEIVLLMVLPVTSPF